jgi:hypothetical protein
MRWLTTAQPWPVCDDSLQAGDRWRQPEQQREVAVASSWLACAGYAVVLLWAVRGVLHVVLARVEQQLAAVDADVKRRFRVAEQRALVGVQPELRPVVEAAMRRAQDEALWLQELIMPPSPLTLRGLLASTATARRLQRLQQADARR